MAKRKSTYVPPFLHVSVNYEGHLMYNLLVRDAVPPTAKRLDAFVQVNDIADHDALAATLVECAATLYKERSKMREELQYIAMRVSMNGLPMGDITNDEELPF